MNSSGGWTNTPNEIYDAIPSMSAPEAMCTMVLVRATYGRKRRRAWLTYADFHERTMFKGTCLISFNCFVMQEMMIRKMRFHKVIEPVLNGQGFYILPFECHTRPRLREDKLRRASIFSSMDMDSCLRRNDRSVCGAYFVKALAEYGDPGSHSAKSMLS